MPHGTAPIPTGIGGSARSTVSASMYPSNDRPALSSEPGGAVTTADGVPIRMISDEDTIKFIGDTLRSEGLQISSEGPVANPGRLALDFTAVASIVSLSTALL